MSTDGRRVVVVGQGYVGLPLAMRAVEIGHTVVGYDIDEERIRRLLAGSSYIEDVSAETLNTVLRSERYFPTADSRGCAGFEVAVVTVPTPLREGNPDLTFVEQSARTLARHLRPGAIVVLESTTYPGTTEGLFGELLEQGSGLQMGADFRLGFSPERIDPGNPVWSFVNTPKVVSGVDPDSLAAVRAFYDQLVERTVPVSSPREAELAKLLENTYRHVNIALVNELAMFAADLGIDVWETIDAAATKPFGFMAFTPGPGVGGHCLPIDPSYLSWQVKRSLGHSFRFVELANDVNDHMPDYVVRRLTLALNRHRKALHGSRVLVLGLAYKRNVGDARQSPAATVVSRIRELGAEVRLADPHVADAQVDPRVTRVDASKEEVVASDAVLVLTDHDAFDWPMVAEQARLVLDTRHRLAASDVVEVL